MGLEKEEGKKFWLRERAAGIFLHLSSLPSRQGIGCLGEAAERWVDFLAECGFRYWQLCPIGPTGFGDSPYQSFSVFAGNPYFIDLDELVRRDYLSGADLDSLRHLPQERVDYGQLYLQVPSLCQRAFERFLSLGQDDDPPFIRFCEEQSFWLPNYSLFMALKEIFQGQPLGRWPKAFRSGESTAKFLKGNACELYRELPLRQKKHDFIQFTFHRQWQHLLEYAHSRGVSLIGDLPIFPGMDSADFWGHRCIFQSDKNGRARCVAGVPPDAYSAEGQLWGNPLFDWDELEKTHYDWWVERLRQAQRSFDITRLDHFRGFYDYWAIPAAAEEARCGRWRPGPGIAFFREILKKIPDLKCIAEDLGLPSSGVHELLRASRFPGMDVLQFAFSGDPKNPYLPHMHEKNSVLYLGTHDNDTTSAWYASLSPEMQDSVRRYFRSDGSSIAWDMIRWAYASPCRLLILSLPDLLALGSNARFNTPSTCGGNWTWRCTSETLQGLQTRSSRYLQELAHIYGREKAP
ncbi:MAG: 4-alpha-glucanotransferase [Puniceicoccales bacterium]|jgi:4-alpha-glucanotransferase|nr:4-alpha-glucanotransferase [Puniceicoccales bacterium]